ncbi:WxL domain-containing protein [Latilactobacillus sakei subsp. carnosus]|nr:WxL domain-containing protein [Latilactobacillus sp.]MCM1571676.1 WxL domain-containing protein [Latilactobacillus sakei]MDV8938346.1 WxL domain-containing protein [Latilactobacillus sp.]MDV8940083.1 WxL domain-containing protein [Latilactobacillus sp.]MDV8941912.1 WxL domain-containing protein [Latilactobacillus sp.]MDV8943696.1 WxL domain-containing protein [Latilactobacillus sp.]
MTLNRRNIMFSLVLLAVMGIQLVVTTGTILAENSIKVDSNLALTSDQELSNEKQIVIRASDQSKAQRDLALTIPEGATFDRTTSNQLNKKSAYTATLDQKNNSNQVILKQTAQTAENIENDLVNRQATTFKKEYLLVFKLKDTGISAKQQLKVTTIMNGVHYESKPLLLKDIVGTDGVQRQTSLSKEDTPQITFNLNQTEYIVGDTIQLKVDLNASEINEPLYINLGNKAILTPIKISSDNGGINFESQNNQNTGKNILKISSNEPIKKDFTLLVKATTVGKVDITASTETDHLISKTATVKVIDNPTSKALAINPNTFDDGIPNWVQKTKTEVGSKAFQGSTSRFLNYTFGGVNGGIDAEADSKISSYNIQGSQINIFIKDNNKTIGAFFKGEDTSSKAVRTSTGFGIVFEPNESNDGPKQAILANKLTNKAYFVGHDSEGNLVSKIMGQFERNGKTLIAEILLRPSLSGTTAVQQELYLKNDTTQSVSYGTFIGQDTMLNGNDKVPMSSMGNNAGLYITQNPYKLAINMKVPDGPINYAAQTWTRRNPWFDGFTPRNFSGTGLEQKNLEEGYTVLKNSDTSYTAKWPFATLAPGESQHYRQDIGITKAPDVAPEAYKEYQNETSTDGSNRPGDNIKFTLRAHNLGLDSSWSDVSFSDIIPSEFQINTNSIRLINQSGQEITISPSAYNEVTRELKVTVPNSVKDNQWVSVTFEAKALTTASGRTVRNTVNVVGIDSNVNQQERSASAIVDVPFIKVQLPELTKKVKNISRLDAKYATETEASIGDEIGYKLVFTNTNSEEVPEAIIEDPLDSDLDEPSAVHVSYKDSNGSEVRSEDLTFTGNQLILKAIPADGSVVLTFETILKDTKKTVINNIAMVADVKSNVAKVNVIKKTPPTLIKEVKNITKSDADYMTETTAEVDDEIEYRIQIVNTASGDIKPGAILKDVFDADLGDIQQVRIDYLDKDEKIIAKQTTDWTDNQVILDHGIPIAGQGMAIAYVKAKVKETNKSVINNSVSLDTDFGAGASEKAKLNIKQSKGRIVVRYRDRKDESHKLAEDETFDGKIGNTRLVQPKVIPETDGNWTVVDSSNMVDPDWGSTTKPDWTLAHDYTVTYAKDEQVITYRYEESHIGIIADKRWDFGKHDTTGTDRNYYLKAKTKDNQKQPYAVSVEDYYTSKGWTLNVKQDDQFHTNANEKIAGDQKFLDNAVLNFHNGQIVLKESDDVGATAPVSKVTSEFELTPKGAAVNLMTHTNKTPDPGYYVAHGFGIWAYQFGDAQQADYSIGLKVPKATKRFPRQYTSQLTWSLVIAE